MDIEILSISEALDGFNPLVAIVWLVSTEHQTTNY